MGNCAFLKLVLFISCRNTHYSAASAVHNSVHFRCLLFVFWFKATHYVWSWALYVSCEHLHCFKNFNTVCCFSPLLVLHALTTSCFVLLCAFLCLVIHLLTCASEQWKISCTLALFAKQYLPVTRERLISILVHCHSDVCVCVLVQHSIYYCTVLKNECIMKTKRNHRRFVLQGNAYYINVDHIHHMSWFAFSFPPHRHHSLEQATAVAPLLVGRVQ